MRQRRLTLFLVPLLFLSLQGGVAFCQDVTPADTVVTPAPQSQEEPVALPTDTAELVQLADSVLQLKLDSAQLAGIDSLLRSDSVYVNDTARIAFNVNALLRDRKENFTPEPMRAMWIGIVFPGGGQIYNRKFWKLPVFYGGFLGCMYALTWNNMMLRDYSQAYLDIMDDDPDTKSYEQMLPLGYNIEGKEERFKTIFKNKKDRYRKYRDLSVFAFIAVYGLSIVDAYVDAELSTFDISGDLSLHFEPAVFGTSPTAAFLGERRAFGLQMNLAF